MRIAIIGAGGVGFHLAHYLADEGHDIVIVEADPERAQYVADRIDALVVTGNGAALPVMRQARIHRAKLLLAVTGDDEVNLISCLAASRLGVGFTVARVSNPEYHARGTVLAPEQLGIDLLISPERECAWETFQLLNSGAAATDLAQFADGRLQLIGLRVREGAPVAGKSLIELDRELRGRRYVAVAIERNGQTEIPTGQSRMDVGDHVFLLAPSEEMRTVPTLAGYPPFQLRRVMIAGGSAESVYLAQHLEAHGVQCTIFERDRKRARELAEALPKALVLHGDATDLALLEMEGVEGVDGFVAFTSQDETNVLSGLVAKTSGARKVISLIHKLDFIPIATRVGIDAAVSPRLSTVNTLLRYVRRGAVQSAVTIKGIDAEVSERVAGPDSPIVGVPLRELRLPKGSLIGGIVRGDEVIMPRGGDVVEVNDRVIIFALPSTIPELERYLR